MREGWETLLQDFGSSLQLVKDIEKPDI